MLDENQIKAFLHGYMEAMFFTETPERLLPRGEFNSKNSKFPWNFEGLSPKAFSIINENCRDFLKEASPYITEMHYTGLCKGPYSPEYVAEEAGMDFWYTRNGHGCGFWDGNWRNDANVFLTNLSHKFPQQSLIVGNDGYLHLL